MNEIYKLKADYARFKRTLRLILDRYPASADAYKYADAALNPPPPPPVTLEGLKDGLRGDRFHYITFYQDGSGGIYNSSDVRIFSFQNLQEASDYLNEHE